MTLNECRYATNMVATIITSSANKRKGLVWRSGFRKLRVLPSSRSRVIADKEIEAKAVSAALNSRSSVDVDKVVVVIGWAGKEAAAIVGQVVELAVLRDSKASLRGTLADGSAVGLSVSQGTDVVNVDLLASGDLDLEAEGVLATGEDGVGRLGALDVGRAGCGGLVEEPEIAVVGVNGCELDRGPRVNGKALERALRCGSCHCRASKGEGESGGRGRLHFYGS